MRPGLGGLLLAIAMLYTTFVWGATYPAGDVAPRGNPDGELNVADLLLVQRFVLGSLIPTSLEHRVADVAPQGSPDGDINAGDLVVLTRVVMGYVNLPPVVVADAPVLDPLPASTTSNPLAINGSAEQGAMVRLYVNGLLRQERMASAADGRFTFMAALTDGDNAIHVASWDGFTESEPSPTQSVTYINQIDRNQANSTITQDTVWTPGVSPTPYIINGSLTVAPGVLFTLMPGTELRFADGAALFIDGGMSIRGEVDRPVHLTSNRQYPYHGSWRGVVINAAASTFAAEHTRVEWAQVGVDVNGIDVEITDSEILNYREAGIRLQFVTGGRIANNRIETSFLWSYQWIIGIELLDSSPNIDANQVGRNRVGVGVYNDSRPLITNNTLTDSEYGLYILGDFFSESQNPQPQVRDNKIYSNSTYNLYIDGYVGASPIVFDISGNWWGSSDPNQFMPAMWSHRLSWSDHTPLLKVNPFLISPEGVASADPYVSGIVTVDTTWAAGQSYRVLGDLLVLDGVTLTLEEGTEGRFIASSGLFVRGVIQAQGAPQSIRLLSDRTEPVRGDWLGLFIGDYVDNAIRTSGSALRGVVIEHVTTGVQIVGDTIPIIDCEVREFTTHGVYFRNHANGQLLGGIIENGDGDALHIYNSEPTINNNILRNAANGAHLLQTDSQLVGNIIEGNQTGVRIYATDPVLEDGNSIINNVYGLHVTGDANPRVNGNSIYNNSSYNYYADQSSDPSGTILDATGNWWGSADAGVIVAGIYDYARSALRAPVVDFSPYLNAPNGSLIESDLLYGLIEGDMLVSAGEQHDLFGGVIIGAGSRLTLEAGSSLRFPAGTGLAVNGDLQVTGAADNPVTFTTVDPSVSAQWEGLEFTASGDRLIVGATIEKARVGITVHSGDLELRDSTLRANYTGLEFMGGVLTAVNNSFTDNRHGLQIHHTYSTLVGPYPSGMISGNRIYDNTSIGLLLDMIDINAPTSVSGNRIVNNTTGVKIYRQANPSLSSNSITDNVNGVIVSSGQFYHNNYPYNRDPQPNFYGNNIAGNQSYNLQVSGYLVSNQNITALNNWWGFADQASIENTILHSADNSGYRTVDYWPASSGPHLLPPVLAGGNRVTNQTPHGLTGEADPGVQVRLYRNGALAATVAPDAQGLFSAELDLNEGMNNLTARTTDGATESLPSNSLAITLDTQAPILTGESPPDGAALNQPQLTLHAGLNESVTLDIAGTPISLAPDYTFSYGPVTMSEGVNTFPLTATDAAGNVTQRTLSYHLDTVPPTSPDPASLVVTEQPGQSLSIDAPAGSAEIGTTATLINARTGVQTALPVADNGGFTITSPGQAGDRFYLLLTDAAGNQSAWLDYNLGGTSPPLAVNIETPLNNTSLASRTAFVQGMVQAPAHSAVTVNGLPALVLADRFYIDLPLQPGAQSIEARVTALDESTVAASVSVDSVAAERLSLHLTETSGIAPFEMRLLLAVDPSISVQRIEFDAEGDGMAETIFNGLEDFITHTYTDPGLYRPRVTLVDTENQVYVADATLLVHGLLAMNSRLRSAYDGMLDAFRNEQVDAGMRYATQTMRDKYRDALTQLGTNIGTVVDQLGEVVGGSIGTDLAQFYVVRQEAGQDKVFTIYLVRDHDGVWRIAEM